MGLKRFLKKAWRFIWYEDSLLSWLANLVLAFVLVKWVIYPGLGLLLGTSFPIVAVVSSSMEHQGQDFDMWWGLHNSYWVDNGWKKEEFMNWSFKNGFNKGDIMIIKGIESKGIKVGDVVVYESNMFRNPIIHRVTGTRFDNGTKKYHFTTKGDNNEYADSREVSEDQVKRTGKAIARVPLLGWIKIFVVSILERVIG